MPQNAGEIALSSWGAARLGAAASWAFSPRRTTSNGGNNP